MKEYGYILKNETFESPFNFFREIRYFVFGLMIEIIAFPILILAILAVFLKERFVRVKPKILFGTSTIVSLLEIQSALEDEFQIDYFVFRKTGMTVKGVEPITPDELFPRWIIQKYPVLIGKYLAFIWALWNYKIFFFYFDGGFLDRTRLYWRLEPILYQLFGCKVVMIPYGADVWDTRKNYNLLHKYGHVSTYFEYFNEDIKREKRIYWWSKYANLVFAPADYLKFLPRTDLMSLTGHVLNIRNYSYRFDDYNNAIKILHFANHGSRKGSERIRKTLEKLALENERIQVTVLEGVSREKAMEALGECHIYIDNLFDGIINYATIEALLCGKIVLTNLDDSIQSFYSQLLGEYYAPLLQRLPILNVSGENLETELRTLLGKTEEFTAMSEASRQFSENLIVDNLAGWRKVVSALLQDYQ